MRLLPDPWLGTNPVFPSTEEPLPANSSVHLPPFAGVVTGVTCGGLFRVIAPRRFPHAIGYGITTFTLMSAALVTFNMNMKSRTVKQLPIVKRENIKIPYRKLWESTKSWSLDDGAMMGSLLGAGAAARTKPQGISLLKLLGTRLIPGAAIGSLLGFAGFCFANLDTMVFKAQVQRNKWNAARVLYRQSEQQHETQEHEPPWLYGELPILVQSLLDPLTNGESTEDELLMAPPVISGTYRYSATYDKNGEVNFTEARDYKWKPSLEEGVHGVQADLDDFVEQRSALARETEYLWYEIGRREKELLPKPLVDEGASEAQKLERGKEVLALIILNGVHRECWNQIAAVDRLIVESKKNMDQLKYGDKWAPPRPKLIDPQTYRPEYLLEQLALHHAAITGNLPGVPEVKEMEAWKTDALLELYLHYEEKTRGSSS